MDNKIISIQNPKIKEIVKLRRTARRKKNDLIVIEGWQEINLAIAGKLEITEIFYCAEFTGQRNINDINIAPINYLSRAAFEKISVRGNPDGYLVLAKPRYFSLATIVLSKRPLVLVIESVEKPGNLGAMLRTADAAGIDAIIITDQKTDIYNHNVIRSSLGTVFTTQPVVCRTEEAIKWLEEKKIKSYATTPYAKKTYTEIDFKQPAAIVIGAENIGLSETWLEAVDEKIKISMLGKIDSLNASVSAAIVIYEALRQRQLD